MRFLTGHKTRFERLHHFVELPLPKDNKELKWCRGMFAYYARWIKDYSAKIKPLTEERVSFPLFPEAESSFESLLGELLQESLGCIDAHKPFTMKCDASDFAVAAVLNQNGGPVAFMSRTLTPCKSRYPIIEKEAASITEPVLKWSYYLRPFTLFTDQRSLAFTFDQTNRGKIKNVKIHAWRTELSMFSYKMIHRPDGVNVAPDALSRVCSVIGQPGAT